jgi:hypothetical protein
MGVEVKRLSGIGVFLVLSILFLAMFPLIKCRAEAPSILGGRVLDKSTLRPIGNATIEVWDITRESSWAWRLVKVGRTDPTGYYSMTIGERFQGRIYAFYDNSSSPGYDYVPAFEDVYLSGEKNLTFILEPGGSILVEGELRFVEASKPADAFTFTVVDPSTGSRPSKKGYVYDYEAKPVGQELLGLGPRQVVVPADTPVDILVNATILVGDKRMYRTFRLSGASFFIVERGQKNRVGMEASLSKLNYDLVEDHVGLAEGSLDAVEQKGFYVTLERQDLARIKELLRKAGRELAGKSYDEAHADLREAYVETLGIDRRLDDIYVNASSSVAILTLFLALMAVALSSVLFERFFLSILGSFVISGLSFATLYYIYPGVRLVQTSSFLMDGGLSLGVALVVYLILLRFMDEKFISIFSIAKQNLKQRRLRFILTLTSVIVLAMSFVTFTSFSIGYGLTSVSFRGGDPGSEGILVRRPVPSNLPATVTFLPLEASTIAWLQGKPEVSIVAPKVENTPRLDSIGAISSSSKPPRRLPLFGVLGIQPSLEARISHLDRSVNRGRYLNDNDSDGVLISQNAAERLGVDVGDELVLSSGVSTMKVFLAGVLDDHRFGSISDLDAQPLMPRKQVRIEGDPPTIVVETCDPSEVIVIDWRTSLEFFQAVSLSRVDIGLSDPSSILAVARRVVLERDLLAWSSYGGTVRRVGLGEYLEAKGMPVMIPWIIVVLNVVVTMLNSLFERRREISILSSLGLNPSHIGGIFMAEAAAIGIVGGGFGYLLGLGGYHATLALSLAVEVRQKVSALWCLASVGIAAAAVLVGTGVALRSSVVITPSLLRRWTMELKAEDAGGKGEFQMPIRLHEDDVDPLLNYLKMRIRDRVLSSYSIDPDQVAKHTKEYDMESSEGHVKSISFNYFFGQTDYLGGFPFSLIAEKKKGDENYTLKLICRGGNEETTQKKATLIRMLIVDWNAQRK